MCGWRGSGGRAGGVGGGGGGGGVIVKGGWEGMLSGLSRREEEDGQLDMI